MRFLAVALLLLSGCLAPQADPDPVPAEPLQAMEMGILLEDCAVVEAFATAEAAVVRPHVPDDFGLVLDGSGRAALVLGGLVCEGVAERGLLAVLVEPVAELHAGEGINHFWEPEHLLVAGTPLAEAFALARANATTAVEVRAELTPTGGLLVVEADGWSHHIQTLPGVVPGGEAGSVFGHFREYAAADGGYAYLEAEFAGDDQSLWGGGVALVETGEGTVARELIGAEATLPFVAGAGLAYAEAKVGFIPR